MLLKKIFHQNEPFASRKFENGLEICSHDEMQEGLLIVSRRENE